MAFSLLGSFALLPTTTSPPPHKSSSSSSSFLPSLYPPDSSFLPFPSSSTSLSSLQATTLSSYPTIYCGRGDKRTAKGKRFKHSFGNARPRNKNKGRGPPRVPTPPAPWKKKDPFDDDEFVEIEIDESLFK